MQIPIEINKPKRKFSKSPLKGRFGSNNNIIFIICILIATLSWMLIKLSSVYSVTYDFQVYYSNPPLDMKLTKVADSNVSISISDKGFPLMKLELFSNMRQLSINIQEYQLTREKDNFYEISTNEIKKQLSEEVGIKSGNIVFSKPYLGFEMEELHKKKVAVFEKHAIELKGQYDLYGEITINPKAITVYGPKSILDSLHKIETETILISKSDSVQTIQSLLVNPFPKLLRLEPGTVTVKYQVEKYTESSLEVPIDISSVKDEITIFPKTVRVSFKIAQKDFNHVRSSLFAIQPVTASIDLNTVNKLKLDMTKKPSFIRDEWMTPTEVEFLIIK